jgi:DNA adenine methylase
MPPHKRYIEVFGGGLAVLYAKPQLTCKECVEVVNDLNGELINLHQQIRNRPETLSIYLNQLLPSRDIFLQIRDKRLRPRNDIERASHYLYLLTYSFGANMGAFAMAKGRKPKRIVRDFNVWSRRLKRVQIENLDFEKLIKEYDHKDSLFYLDPPYFKTENYYKNVDFGKDGHARLRDALAKIEGKFILSYNDDEFIRELYSDFKIVEVETKYSLSPKFRGEKKFELLIMNY